ncbi:MAG: hypothetical protein ACT4PN_13165 [Nitrospiraceae bacterium]
MTILVLGVVLLVLGVCGIWYWKYVESKTLLIQERNFRALTVTSHALREMVTNYESVFKSVIEGKPPCTKRPCPEEERHKFYEEALLALPAFEELQAGNAVRAFDEVKVTKEQYEDEGYAVKFIYDSGKSSIKLTYVHQDRAKPIQTRWKVAAVMNIGPIMRQLVTEDIFSDVLLTDRIGRVLYHHQSTRDPSGFEFEDVSSLLHRVNGSEPKESGNEKGGVGRNENLISTLPLFNEAPIGGVAHAIFAQATDLPADRGAAQTVILVGIVPAGQFHAESRAIALNVLLVMVGFTLVLFFVLPYVKLRTNAPTERVTPISVAVLVVSSILGVAVLTFGLADFETYHNLEQHLDKQLEKVSEEIRSRFVKDVQRGLNQLKKIDQACPDGKCWNRPNVAGAPHCAQHLSIAKAKEGGTDKEFSFNPIDVSGCSEGNDTTTATEVIYRDVISMLWIELNTGDLTALQSRESAPWKHVNLKDRQYVRRILEDETLIRERDGEKFWIEPIFSRTTGENTAVFSINSRRSTGQLIVAALEVKLPSVTSSAVPPGMGFAVIDQEGKVLFHSDARRNLRENFFEEADRDGRLRQAVFAHVLDQFDGRYWGKDRHFHIAPLFAQNSEPIIESPDVHWSLVTYWDIDMLRDLNLRALYSSGALFLIYALIALSIAIPVWWISSRANEATYRWVWPQSGHLQSYQIAMWLLVASLTAVGIWYLRPHPAPEMLFWSLLPALAAAGVILSTYHTKPDPAGHSRTDASARPSYRLSYALVVTLALLVFVVVPALAIFRVAFDVEWRLLAKFALYDLERDRELQAKKVRLSFPSTLFGDSDKKGEVRVAFLKTFSDQTVVYDDFPFERCRQESQNCREVSTNVVQRDYERLIQWFIERPRLDTSRNETDTFLKEPQFLTGRKLQFESGSETLRLGDRFHAVPSPIPEWLYSLLILGGFLPLAVLRVKKAYAFAAVMGALAVFLLFGLVREVLVVLWVSALLYGTYHAWPTFAARRVLLLDYPYPPTNSSVPEKWHEISGMIEAAKPPVGWSAGLWGIFVKEMSALPNPQCLIDQQTFHEKILKQDSKDDFGIEKEQIIREILERLTQYYLQIWKKSTGSQRRSLFNLARDGFLHARNPDIEPLLESGVVVADLKLRPMNESFRRFIIKRGLEEHLDEDIAQARTSPWFQVWRPIGVGVVLVMVFLVLTQEQYRTITLAFLGVLPGLLGAFSQALAAPKKEKPETAPPA